MTGLQPAGKTRFGVTVWRLPGAEVRHLAWGGPGDRVHLHRRGRPAGGRTELIGKDAGTVSEPCGTLAEAQAAVDAYTAGAAKA